MAPSIEAERLGALQGAGCVTLNGGYTAEEVVVDCDRDHARQPFLPLTIYRLSVPTHRAPSPLAHSTPACGLSESRALALALDRILPPLRVCLQASSLLPDPHSSQSLRSTAHGQRGRYHLLLDPVISLTHAQRERRPLSNPSRHPETEPWIQRTTRPPRVEECRGALPHPTLPSHPIQKRRTSHPRARSAMQTAHSRMAKGAARVLVVEEAVVPSPERHRASLLPPPSQTRQRGGDWPALPPQSPTTAPMLLLLRPSEAA